MKLSEALFNIHLNLEDMAERPCDESPCFESVLNCSVTVKKWTAKAIELEQQIEKMKWHPIETAPKDGREILLKVEYRAGVPGKCLVGHYMAGGHCIEGHPPIDEGWYFWNGCMFDKASKPVEWMELKQDKE